MAGKPTIAVIGGTGAEGSGLAKRWAAAGYPVIIGSRSAERGTAAAYQLSAALSGREGAVRLRGTSNESAAAEGDIVVLTVPYAAHADTLNGIKEFLDGKVLVDCTVPLRPRAVTRVQLPEAGSAALEAQQLLGEGVRVVSAFQNISAELLDDPEQHLDCDILISGDDPDARQVVVELAEAAGLVGLHAGPLSNSVAAEALTSILIFINKRYKARHSGIRVTNLPGRLSGDSA